MKYANFLVRCESKQNCKTNYPLGWIARAQFLADAGPSSLQLRSGQLCCTLIPPVSWHRVGRLMCEVHSLNPQMVTSICQMCVFMFLLVVVGPCIAQTCSPWVCSDQGKCWHLILCLFEEISAWGDSTRHLVDGYNCVGNFSVHLRDGY
jgi:hypothetical protein